jgi:hypothetical protein
MDPATHQLQQFEGQLSADEKKIMDGLRTPALIQDFLDETIYPGGSENRSPVEVLRQRKAHCLDGGLFAVAALRRLGYPPLILDIQPDEGMDDDHVLALFRVNGCWGAVAKSNFSGLRFREPIYRTTRELVLSYFNDFFNMNRVKTLRFYSRVINLKRFDQLNWMTDFHGVDAVEAHLKIVKLIPLLTAQQVEQLSMLDRRSFEAGTLGTNPDGAFYPDSDHS